MNLYNKNFESFKEILDTLDNIKIDLMEYDNQKEKELLELFIKKYKETSNSNILEELHRLCECEIIFNCVWSLDKNEMYKNILNFDLDSVYGSSFMHEFIKQIQLGQLDYFDDFVAVCSIKYFKTPKKAETYFDSLIQRVKNIPGINLADTMRQRQNFIDMFTKHRSLYVPNL